MDAGVATGAGAFATSYAVLPRLGIYDSTAINIQIWSG